MPRPEFRDGDIVMICQHLYERACKGHDIAWKVVTCVGRMIPRPAFNRDDGTAGAYDFAVMCGRCARLPLGETLFIEEVFKRGQFHVADHIRNIPTVEMKKAGA